MTFTTISVVVLKARDNCCFCFREFGHVFLVTLLTFLSKQLYKNITTFTYPSSVNLDAYTKDFFLVRAAKYW